MGGDIKEDFDSLGNDDEMIFKDGERECFCFDRKEGNHD